MRIFNLQIDLYPGIGQRLIEINQYVLSYILAGRSKTESKLILDHWKILTRYTFNNCRHVSLISNVKIGQI